MKIFKKTVTVLLCIIMYVSFAAGVTALMVGNTMDDSNTLSIRIIDNKYKSTLYESVYAALEREMALVAIQPEDISDIITEEFLAEEAPLAAASLLDRIFGGDSEEWVFESDVLYERIVALLGDYAEDAGIEYEDGSAELVYGMICDTVTAEVRVIPQNYVSKIAPIFVKLRTVCECWFISMILYAVCAAGVIILGKRYLKNAIYNAVLPTYFSVFTLFAMSSLLYSKDYLSKTVLSDGMFQYFLRQVYNTALYDIKQIAAVLTFTLLFMGLVVAVALAVNKKKHSSHHRHHRKHGDAEHAADN